MFTTAKFTKNKQSCGTFVATVPEKFEECGCKLVI
jgi:hypothetical protein